jgi:hypothetical protein
MKWVGIALCASLWGMAGAAAADPAAGHGFAIVIGSNVGGPGQGELRYAERDAGRVAEVMGSLGGYQEAGIERLTQPSAAALRAALERVRARIEPLAARGEQSRFFFYYSGHARADGLNLGAEQLPLTELRERIEALPATLSIVVLDGCQSGAFSRVKGADKAADFSWNSLERLNSEGIAVVASSSARELSQESDELRSGYFTHHWLVALRGGGDRDGDGRVTLSEAYQYAYNHTLANTAQTAVGEQHATLETNIRGKDDVALTHPAAANTRLRIPTSYAGRVLIQRLPNYSVWAELDKAASAPVLLALPAGDYVITLRRGNEAARCTMALREGVETELARGVCLKTESLMSAPKGGPERVPRQRIFGGGPDRGAETWLLEFAFGAGGGHSDSEYVRRLEDFGFVRDRMMELTPRFSLSLQRRLLPNLAVGLNYFNLNPDDYARHIEIVQDFEWNAHAVGPYLQGDIGFGRRRFFSLYLQVGAGLSIAWTTMDAVVPFGAVEDRNPSFQDTTVDTREVTQHYFRPCGWLAGGLRITPWRYFGFTIQGRFSLARAIENELGEVHDVGGGAVLFGVHVRSWE